MSYLGPRERTHWLTDADRLKALQQLVELLRRENRQLNALLTRATAQNEWYAAHYVPRSSITLGGSRAVEVRR